MASVLFAGESVLRHEVLHRGFHSYGLTSYVNESHGLVDALRDAGHEVTWLPSERVPQDFPETTAELGRYDVVILSDLGADTLLHPIVLAAGGLRPDRMQVLREWVHDDGGGLLMCGGWLSFAGMDGKARYAETPVEEALPVTMSRLDDRQERPSGAFPHVVENPSGDGRSLVHGLPAPWPPLLGYNRVAAKPGTSTLATIGADPLLVTGTFGRGRSAAWMSDVAPHWCPSWFSEWTGFAPLFTRLAAWLAEPGPPTP